MTISETYKDKIAAAADFVGHTGASAFQLRYSDDEEPTVWFAVAVYDGRNPTGIKGSEAAAATDPMRAALRLCETLCDGGHCLHCERPTGFEPDSLEAMPMNEAICWWQYDPESKKFVRGCLIPHVPDPTEIIDGRRRGWQG